MNKDQIREVNPSGAKATNTESVLNDNRIKFIKSMEISDIVKACENHSDNLKEIHLDIISTWKMQGSLTEPQVNVLESYIQHYAPEIGLETQTATQ